METALELWRQQERENLIALYDAIEACIGADKSARREKIQAVLAVLAVPERGALPVPTPDKLAIPLADGFLEIAMDEDRAPYMADMLAQWRDEAAQPCRWNTPRAIDEHIIHFHLKRIHAPDVEVWQGMKSLKLPASYDVLETDRLTLHILASDYVVASEDPEEATENSIAAVQGMLTEIDQLTEHEGLQRVGIHLHMNARTDEFRIEDNKVTYSGAIPETVKGAMEGAIVGMRFDQLFDLNGFRHPHLTIQNFRETGWGAMEMEINRQDEALRVHLDLSSSAS